MIEPNYELPEPPEFSQDLTPPENGLSTTTGNAVMITDDAGDDGAATKHAEQLDQAFGVKPFFWKEIQLAPFAIDREGDWMRHREMLGDAPLSEVIGLPVALVPDALRVIWFCAVDPREWLVIPSMGLDDEGNFYRLSSQERALKVEEKIRAWAAEHVSNREGVLAVELFYEIFQSAQATRAVAKPSEHHKEAAAKN